MANIIGTAASETLNGTDGPDTLDGIVGADSLYGNAGDDRFVFSGVQSSYPAPPAGLIDGGAGFDEIDVRGVSPVSLSSNSLTVGNQAFALQSIERIILNDQSRYLYVSGESYEVVSGAGNDNISVYEAAKVDAGAGDDRMWVSGGGAQSTGHLYAGAGTDLLETNILAKIDLEAGTASVFRAEFAISGFENVAVTGYGTDTAVRGDVGDNILSLREGSYAGGLLDGRAGNDTLDGSKYSDSLYGGDGNDRIAAKAGADFVFGGTGGDVIAALADGDTIDGGAGVDTVNYNGLTRAYTSTHGNFAATVGQTGTTDTISGVEKINFRDATLTFDADSNAAFVMRLYDSTLDREPDALGLDYWLDQMDAGVSKSAVANAFLQSPEFAEAAGTLSTGDFVDFLYTEALGRPSDANGKVYWAGRIDGGLARSDALQDFSESAEHRLQTTDTLSEGLWVTNNNYQAIAALYDTFSDRLPDEGGLGYWVGQIQSGVSLSQIAGGFAKSPEFSQATVGFSNGQLVDFMYENTLNREADAGGRANWVSQLDAGLSKGDLLLGFSSSNEHYQMLEQHLFAGVDFLM